MVLIRKKMLVVLLALLGTILLVTGINFFSVKASASSFRYTATPDTSVVVGVAEKDNYFKYPNVENIKPEQGKYENSDTHNKYVINEIYFALTDPELTKSDYILVPKDCYLSWDYTWIGIGIGVFPVSVRDQIHLIDLSDYGISGAKLQIKQRLKEDDHFQVSDDTWDKGIDGIPNSNIRIGRGVLFFRTDTYDIERKKTEGTYSKVTNLADIGYNNISSSFVNIKEECDVKAVICYEVYNHGWWWWDNEHYNIRYDYEIKYRNNTSDLVTKDTNTKSELSNNHSLDGKAGKTTNGFYIDTAGNKFYNVKYRYNEGNLISLSNSQIYINSNSNMSKVKKFTSDGKYEISYENAFGKTFTQTVYVDKSTSPQSLSANKTTNVTAPVVNVNGRRYYGTPFNFTWTNKTNYLPWTAEMEYKAEDEKEYGTATSYTSGRAINQLGDYRITFANGLCTYSFEFTLGEYIPDKNYQALISMSEKKNVWNFKSKYYGADRTNNGQSIRYAYASMAEAQSKLAMDIFDNEVEKITGGYRYKGTVYTTNQAIMNVLNSEVSTMMKNGEIKVLYYDPFKTQEIKYQNNLVDSQIYLNGYTFYKYDGRYSNKLYCIPMGKDENGNYESVDLTQPRELINNASNKINLEYGKPFNQQIELAGMGSGKYIIIEENVYEDLYGFEAYYVKENETEVKIGYVSSSGTAASKIVNRTSHASMTVQSFSIDLIKNIIDDGAIVKIKKPSGEILYAAVGETIKTMSESGEYKIVIYDRFRNATRTEIEMTIMIVSADGYWIEGATNGATGIDHEVTIYYDNKKYKVTQFNKNGDVAEYKTIDTGNGVSKIILEPSATADAYSIVLDGGNITPRIMLMFIAV